MTMPTETTPTDADLIAFVVREARMLDEHRFEEWLDLFAEDGHYWMPLEWGQTDPILVGSLLYEDRLLLRIRVERLKGNRTFSQKPKSRCHHVLQAPRWTVATTRPASTTSTRPSTTWRRALTSRNCSPAGPVTTSCSSTGRCGSS